MAKTTATKSKTRALPTSKAKPSSKLGKTFKGKVRKINKDNKKIKQTKKSNGLPPAAKTSGVKKSNAKDKAKQKSSKPAKIRDEEFSREVKKKPSKVELKKVIEVLKKDPKSVVVRKALKYVPHYLKSEGLTKKLLKEIIRLWAEAGEKVRIVCLLCLIRIYTKKSEFRQLIIKKLYNTFLEKCRITKEETMSMIKFMRHSLVELYKLDTEIAFKQAQASIQQLTLSLKNANIHRNEDTYKSVLNWQFANCLTLLSILVISVDEDNQIKTLTQKIIQLNLGAIDFLKSPRYYPFYCHLIENLIGLSESSDLFIPILPLLVGIIDQIQIVAIDKKTKRPKKNAKKKNNSKDEHEEKADADEKEEKTYNIDILNHVKLEESQNANYKLAVLDKVYELMSRYVTNNSHRIAFPELMLLPNVHIKKWLKKNPDHETQKFKNLLEKIKTDCETIEESRRSVDFAFSNYAAVDAWEKRLKDSGKLTLPKMLKKLEAESE